MSIRPFIPALPSYIRTTYHRNVWISLLDRFFKQLKTLGIFQSVIFTADLYILQSERFRMSMSSPQGSHNGIGRFIGISDSVQGILYQFPHRRYIFITRTAALVGHTAINDIDWFGIQIFTHLEIFMIADAVRRTVCPHIPKMFAFGNVSYGFTPDRIGSRRIPFYKTSTGEANESRFQCCNQFHQFRT